MEKLKVLPAVNPEAVDRGDDYLVVRIKEGTTRIVESQLTLAKAEKACRILNDHDRERGRIPTCYVYTLDEIEIVNT